LTYTNWKLNAPEIKLRLQDGTLHIDKLKGELFSGSVDLEGTIEAGINKGKGLAIDVKGAFRDVGARQFSNAMLGADLNVMDGGITLESELSTNGVSPAALALALNGQGSISSSDFVIHGIELNSLAHALRDDVSTQGAIDNLVRFMRSPFRGGETRFTDINGEFDIDKGVVSLNNTKLEAKGFVMTSKGTINLPRWKLDLMNTVSFPDDKNVPSFDIIVRGPLDEPARGLRDQMMRNFLEDRINNKARRFVTDELNKLFGGDLKTSPDSGDQNQKPDNSTGAADADKGQDGRAQRDNDSSTSGQTKQEGTGDQSIETIKPDNIKDNGSGHDDSKIERISPEDAVQGVIDRLNP
jgi:hypothetical protein